MIDKEQIIYTNNEPVAVYIQNDSNTLYALHTNFNGSIEKISDHAGNIGKANPSPIPILISV